MQQRRFITSPIIEIVRRNKMKFETEARIVIAAIIVMFIILVIIANVIGE